MQARPLLTDNNKGAFVKQDFFKFLPPHFLEISRAAAEKWKKPNISTTIAPISMKLYAGETVFNGEQQGFIFSNGFLKRGCFFLGAGRQGGSLSGRLWEWGREKQLSAF